MNRCDQKGFTLLEILIVVVILGALAALAIPAYTATTEKAKKQEAFMALAAVREAQQRYYIANTSYANAFSSLDFDPSTSLTGQTPIFTYTVGTTTDASHWTAKASRTGLAPAPCHRVAAAPALASPARRPEWYESVPRAAPPAH